LIEIALAVWGMVSLYAVAHDQYIVRLAPEHFTVYHPAVPGVTSAPLQAAILALLAAVAPGLAFGVMLALAAQAGPEPRIPVRHALMGAGCVIGLAEIVSVAAGIAAWVKGAPLYGHDRFFVPGMPLMLVITQTIQITCYAVSALLSAALGLGCIVERLRRARSAM
jgi:hypothetical protein